MGGAMQLGQAAPQFEAIAAARGAAYQVFKVIDRVSAPPTNLPSAPEQLQMPFSFTLFGLVETNIAKVLELFGRRGNASLSCDHDFESAFRAQNDSFSRRSYCRLYREETDRALEVKVT